MLKKNFALLVLAFAFISTSMLSAAETVLSGNVYQKPAQNASYVAFQNIDLSFFLMGELVAQATTDESGHFAIRNLKEANYLLVAESVDGESYGVSSLFVKYDENGNFVSNFKLSKVGLQKLPADFDPLSGDSIRGQNELVGDPLPEEPVAAPAPADTAAAPVMPQQMYLPNNGADVATLGSCGGVGFLAIAGAIAGVVVAIAVDDEDASPYQPR
ncbi:MAG: hypothetical protein Q4C95_04720 [Planctomycetia bacterium]|nr:hypothetical protein [Planctomycetia bacterium]